MPEYILVNTAKEYKIASMLFKEYADWLNIDLCFQHFEEELKTLHKMYSYPTGGIILAKVENEFIGSVALRKIDSNVAELKRMYVKPAFQKNGFGSSLLNEAILLAKKLGYKKIRLDTLNNMVPAIELYKRNGFYEIPAYYHNPETTAVYFEKLISNND